MANITNRNNFTPLLDYGKVSQGKIRNWNVIQENSLSHTVQLIESEGNSILLYNPSKRHRKVGWIKALDRLVVTFLRQKNKVNQGLRNEIKSDTKSFGLLMPVEDITRMIPDDLTHGMNVLSQFTAELEFVELLDYLKGDKKEKTVDLPLPLDGTLFLIEKYINQVLSTESLIKSISHLEGWISYCSVPHKHQLRTHQFLSWILETIDNSITNIKTTQFEVFNEYDESVQLLIDKYQKVFSEELKLVKETNSKYFYFSTFPEFREDLRLLLDKDLDLWMLREFLDLRDRVEIADRDKYNYLFQKALDQDSITDIISKVFNRKNIISSVKSILILDNSIQKISLFAGEELHFENWKGYEDRLEDYEYEMLVEIAKSTAELDNGVYSKNIVAAKNDYLNKLANSICRPFYKWESINGQSIPKLNLADQKVANDAMEFLKGKKAHEKKEADILKNYIKAIKVVQTRTGLDNLINTIPRFFYASNQKRWNIAIRDAEKAIKMRTAFRSLKMKELGIDLDQNFTEAQREVFLTEMLTIEEEIQSFVPYVTSAFQSALPSKRTTEFDAYRHQSDGIEFDPETVFDPEKWIRGNVMKTLKTKIKKGEITQVNCFCLDLSGSMNHDRMRNLYKILYLLVTGLQSRKSYDAFHFFSNNFIPGVDFQDGFTSKSLLFKILSIVGEVVGPRIEYFGRAGTNISEGIEGCETKMHEFIAELRAKQPAISLTCSMFVITDGEPSMGVRKPKELNKFIEQKRKESNFAIKGIYIKSQEDKNQFITTIFGEGNAAETSSFEEAVQKLTAMMTTTYRQQRINHKWDIKRAHISGKQS